METSSRPLIRLAEGTIGDNDDDWALWLVEVQTRFGTPSCLELRVNGDARHVCTTEALLAADRAPRWNGLIGALMVASLGPDRRLDVLVTEFRTDVGNGEIINSTTGSRPVPIHRRDGTHAGFVVEGLREGDIAVAARSREAQEERKLPRERQDVGVVGEWVAPPVISDL